MPVKEERRLRSKNRCLKILIKPAFSETRQTKGQKSAVHQENPFELNTLAATLSLACVAGTKKEGEGRGGEGEKSAKGKREREPFLLSSITSFTPPSV